MKKITSFIIILMFLSCSKEANKPTDENLDLGHDNWSKVSIFFTEGEVSDKGFKGYQNDKSLKFKTVQEYTFTSEDLEIIPSGNTIKLVSGKTYGLEIKYYNNHNILMNYQFATPEMAPIHQHFFISSLEEGNLKQFEKNTIDYVYRDTEPIDQMIGENGVRLRGKKDPIGLKGYFKVLNNRNKKNNKLISEFDLNIILIHILGTSKLEENNGEPYLFYAPSKNIISSSDLSQVIPMKIFTNINNQSYIKDIADEFQISEEQAKKEVNKRVLGKLKL